jgi:hypothetical protein
MPFFNYYARAVLSSDSVWFSCDDGSSSSNYYSLENDDLSDFSNPLLSIYYACEEITGVLLPF